MGTCLTQVGLDSKEEVASLEALSMVLGDGDLKVRVEAGGQLGGPSDEVEAEGNRDVVLHHGP